MHRFRGISKNVFQKIFQHNFVFFKGRYAVFDVVVLYIACNVAKPYAIRYQQKTCLPVLCVEV